MTDIVDLSGKVVLVTGASRGIGAAIVRSVAEAGADVVIHCNQNRARAEALVESVGPARCHLVQADFMSLDSVEELWRQAVSWKGRIDVLVNNAAVQLWAGVDDPLSQWDEIFDTTLRVNVLAMARMTREAVLHFRGRGGGIVVGISSQAAHRGVTSPESLAYAASKAGIKAFMQSIARAFAADGVLAYIVAPGLVRTEMAEDFATRKGGEDALTATLAMREWVPPEDIANLVAFLATGKARHATGTTIDVTGATYVR